MLILDKTIEHLKTFENQSDEEVFVEHLITYLNEFHQVNQLNLKPITININHLEQNIPIELNIYHNIMNNHQHSHTLITNIVQDWAEKTKDVYYELETDHNIRFYSEEDLSHHKIGKLCVFHGVFDVYMPWEIKITKFIFVCPECSAKWFSLSSKNSKCNCGKDKIKYAKKEYCSEMRFYISDMAKPLISKPLELIYQIKDVEYDQYHVGTHLIGQHLQILGFVDEIENKGKSTIQIIVRGIKKYDARKIDFKRMKLIIEKIQSTPDVIRKLAMSMTKEVYGNEIQRQIMLLAFIGLKKPDPDFPNEHTAFNVAMFGDPSAGKTYPGKLFKRFFPNAYEVQGKSATPLGMLGGSNRESENKPQYIKSGLIQKANNGVILMDELNTTHPDIINALLTAMSEGQHTLARVSGDRTFYYNTNFLMSGNPIHGHFNPHTKKLSQLDFPSAFFSRLHLILFIDPPYVVNNQMDETEFKEYAMYRSYRKCYPQDFDDDFLLDYAQLIKDQPNPTLSEETKLEHEQYMLETKKLNYNPDFIEASDSGKKQLDDRHFNGILLLAKIIALAKFKNCVEMSDYRMAVKFVEYAVQKLMSYDLSGVKVLEEKVSQAEKTKIPVTWTQKIEMVLQMIPKNGSADWIDLLKQCVDVGISELELDKILVNLVSKSGDVSEVSRNNYRRL